jgi:hypothetical protein
LGLVAIALTIFGLLDGLPIMTAGPCVSLAKIRSIPEKTSSATYCNGGYGGWVSAAVVVTGAGLVDDDLT